MKVKIKTDIPVEWSSSMPLKSEITFDTEQAHEDGNKMLIGLICTAISPMFYGDVKKITVEKINED
tara:strand:- start:2279 stop:2476 length:198 start_codon:yes stop_codon:yes gene_type:complete